MLYPKYDELMLAICVAAYNEKYGTDYSAEDMKKAFEEQGETFEAYEEWYYDGGSSEFYTLNNEIIHSITEAELRKMTPEELDNYIDEYMKKREKNG